MSFFDFLNGDNNENKHDVTVREPGLSGKFADAGLAQRETVQRIYASPDTMGKLNGIHPELAGTVAEISGADNVIFVSRDDIVPEIKRVDDANGMGGMNVLHNESYPHYEEAFDGFRNKFSDPPPLIAPGSAMDAYNEDASSTLYRHENGQSYAIITLPDMEQTADEHFRKTANIKGVTKQSDGELVKTQVRMPESEGEALNKATIASDLLHEAGHSGLGHSNAGADDAKILHQEQEADGISAMVTPYLFPEVGDAAVQLNQEARAVGAMLLEDHDHDTNADLHNDKSVTSKQQLESIETIHEAVVEQVAKDIGTDDLNEARELVNDDPQLQYAILDKLNQSGSFKDDPVAQEYVDDYMQAGESRVPEYLGVKEEPSVAAPTLVSDVPATNTEQPTFSAPGM